MIALAPRSSCILALCALLVAAATASAADKDTTNARRCEKAQRRVVNEERAHAKGEATVEHDRRERATCAMRSICERYDARIKAMETRNARHGARVVKFKAEAAKVCATS